MNGKILIAAILTFSLAGCGPDDEPDGDSEFETEIEETGAAAPDVTGRTTPPPVPPPGESLDADSSEVILEQ